MRSDNSGTARIKEFLKEALALWGERTLALGASRCRLR